MSLLETFVTVFEITNELYTAIASGFLGMMVLVKEGIMHKQPLKTLSVLSVTTLGLMFVTRQTQKLPPSKKKVVLITGCDSGLGFSLAMHTASMGYSVVATYLSFESKGYIELKELLEGNNLQVQLDITKPDSVQAAVKSVKRFLDQNPEYSLYAVINNAGVMVFGEFEWLTENLIKKQIDVNIMGTLRFTKAMTPLLIQYQARLITVTSHCSQATLPGLAVYGATKSALTAWSDGLRVELAKYNVNVITFIPGSFVMQSSIMANHVTHFQEMHGSFTKEQHYRCGEYFKAYNVYLIQALASKISESTEIISDPGLYRVFECTLLDKYPKVLYKNESLHYAFYHFLFKYSPWSVRDYLITRFVQMPLYNPDVEQCFEEPMQKAEGSRSFTQSPIDQNPHITCKLCQ